MKECTKCNITKATTEFSRKTISKDGLATYCKQCDNAKHNTYKAYFNRTYSTMKSTSKKQGLEAPDFTVEELKDFIKSNYKDEIEQLFKAYVDGGKVSHTKPSILRNDTTKPYTLESLFVKANGVKVKRVVATRKPRAILQTVVEPNNKPKSVVKTNSFKFHIIQVNNDIHIRYHNTKFNSDNLKEQYKKSIFKDSFIVNEDGRDGYKSKVSRIFKNKQHHIVKDTSYQEFTNMMNEVPVIEPMQDNIPFIETIKPTTPIQEHSKTVIEAPKQSIEQSFDLKPKEVTVKEHIRTINTIPKAKQCKSLWCKFIVIIKSLFI